jgi:hypothetical protein
LNQPIPGDSLEGARQSLSTVLGTAKYTPEQLPLNRNKAMVAAPDLFSKNALFPMLEI